jgi:hypothetical protein
MSVKAHAVDSTATSEKRWNDFEAELVRDLAGLRRLYIHNIQVIGGLCSPMSKANPSAADYIRWLYTEVVGLLKMFADVNENFVSAAVEGALVMAGDSVDLDALKDVATESGPDISPLDQDVRRVVREISKKRWCSFNYNYVMTAIRTNLHEVTTNG